VARTIPRRRFLQTAAGLGGGLATAGFAQLFGASTAHAQLQDAEDTLQTIVNLAATAEALAITAYYHTIANNPLGFDAATLVYLKLAMTAEQYHLEFLQSAGGEAITTEFYVPEAFFQDRATNAQTFVALETAFIGAYLAATRRFAELGEPRLAATTAQHAASETEHLTLLRLIGGLLPLNPNGLPAPIYYNVSDAVPTLVPFIQGGTGLIGPIGLPGAAAVRTLAGSDQAVRVPTFTQVF
jgi:hypothetical protein